MVNHILYINIAYTVMLYSTGTGKWHRDITNNNYIYVYDENTTSMSILQLLCIIHFYGRPVFEKVQVALQVIQ